MKVLLNTLIGFLILFDACSQQSIPKKEIYNEEFKWTIAIPEGFKNVSTKEWTKIQNKGLQVLENTYNEEVINEVETIFVFKSDGVNYFEANYQPFDTEIDGDYIESCKYINKMIYQPLKSQAPDMQMDTISSTEVIDSLKFQKFEIEIKSSDSFVMKIVTFNRLFDKKDFSVNIMYNDKLKGSKMLDSWRNSKFGKEI